MSSAKHKGLKTNKELERYSKSVKNSDPGSTIDKSLDFEATNETNDIDSEETKFNLSKTKPLKIHESIIIHLSRNIFNYISGLLIVVITFLFVDAKVELALLDKSALSNKENITKNENKIIKNTEMHQQIIISHKNDLINLNEKIYTIENNMNSGFSDINSIISELDHKNELQNLKNQILIEQNTNGD